MTPSQLVALKADILADPTLAAQAGSPDGRFAIAAAYNLPAFPAWYVWRTAVTEAEIFNNGMDWARVDNLSVGKARIWEWMFKFGSINPGKPNVRAGIEAVWVGTAADLAVRAAVYGHCKSNATRGQKLFSTGTGTTESPASLQAGIGGDFTVTFNDVDAALNMP